MTRAVLVVGAGPVGLTMALELARYRVPVRIVDETAARTDQSRALAVWARTLELLDRAGCAEDFVATGLQATAVTIFAGGELVARVGLDQVESTFPGVVIIPQSDSERLLETHLQRQGVTVERQVALTGFTDHGDSVSCTLRHADGGVETVEASWLVGCDGARSLVRRTLAKPFVGDTLATNFILADVRIAALDTRRPSSRFSGTRWRAGVLPDRAGALSHHRRHRRGPAAPIRRSPRSRPSSISADRVA